MKIKSYKIKLILAEREMQQGDLAKECGVTRQNISAILARGSCHPTDEISRYLGEGISVNELVTAVQEMTSRRESVNSNTQSIKPADFSDAGNAEIFSREYSPYLSYVDSMGWLYWNGKKWERNEHKAMLMAIEFSARLRLEAMEEYTAALHAEATAKANNPDGGEEVKKAVEATKQAKAFLTHANITRRAARIKAILELALNSRLFVL